MWGSDIPCSPRTQEGKLLPQPPWAFAGQIPFQAWIACTSPGDSQVHFYTSYSQKECQSFDPGYWLTRGILYSMDRIMQTAWPKMYAQMRGLRSKGLAAHGISTWFLLLWELQVQPVFMKVTSTHNCVISSIYWLVHSCASDSFFILSNGRLFHKLQIHNSHTDISYCLFHFIAP